MAGRIKLSFHYKVLFTLLFLCVILVGSFLLYQYEREKRFRVELFNKELQIFNDRMIDDLRNGKNVDSIVLANAPAVDDLRITLIDSNGNVIFDNNDKTPFPTTNHNDRPEIIQAREKGYGFAVERMSVSDEKEYFYSAAKGDDGVIVRSAAPYTHSLKDFLKADNSFLWIMLSLTFIVCLIGYFLTRRISTSIARLNSFAEKATKGDNIYDEWAFPHDELGNIAGNIVRLYVQRDQSHQKALAQEREKIQIKKELTNNISHELKTPVAAIKICAELLKDHPELPEDRKQEFIDRICENSDRLSLLLQDISALTRMDDGADVIEKEMLDIDRLVNKVVDEERLTTEMTFVVDLQPAEIYGNRKILESLFRNLIVNAVAYSGGTEIRIESDSEGNFIFKDNGTGIPEEHHSRIFERFYRIDKGRSRDAGGTGLGLAIVKNAVAIHGGKIKVRNENGLRFDFNLLTKMQH